ncbi:hypothetical protein PTI98_008782 [Pleurotus ostreatus]|nr:hypothetical protein PTI98_008782 [Pleurotus ostreatus]
MWQCKILVKVSIRARRVIKSFSIFSLNLKYANEIVQQVRVLGSPVGRSGTFVALLCSERPNCRNSRYSLFPSKAASDTK